MHNKNLIMNKKNLTNNRATKLLLLLMLLSVWACLPFRSSPDNSEESSYGEFNKRSNSSLIEKPKRLIDDYRGMQEHEKVYWQWMSPGVELRQCRTANISPLFNYSNFDYAWAEAEIERTIGKIFSELCDAGSSLDIGVTAAIVDMKPKRGTFKRMFFLEEEYPFIEVEIVIVETATESVLAKICHASKGKSLKEAVDRMVNDLGGFFLIEPGDN
jgi:hypothetical protein